MAVPKRKTSHSRKRNRSSGKALEVIDFQKKDGIPVRHHCISLTAIKLAKPKKKEAYI
jgi:ribosomal protein L32